MRKERSVAENGQNARACQAAQRRTEPAHSQHALFQVTFR